jgi:C1A family cysteine protease
LKAPVAIAVDSDSDVFNFTKGDKPIRSHECKGNLGHAVLAVGYGHYDGDQYPCDYVIIKNSYGDDWGDKGYGMISLSQKHRKSAVCGVLGEGFWTEVSKENAAKK